MLLRRAAAAATCAVPTQRSVFRMTVRTAKQVVAKKTTPKYPGYALSEAVKLVHAFATANYDETVEVAIKTGVDPRKPNQMIRGEQNAGAHIPTHQLTRLVALQTISTFNAPTLSTHPESGTATLPHGTGKSVKVAVFAKGPRAEEARAAGADIVVSS